MSNIKNIYLERCVMLKKHSLATAIFFLIHLSSAFSQSDSIKVQTLENQVSEQSQQIQHLKTANQAAYIILGLSLAIFLVLGGIYFWKKRNQQQESVLQQFEQEKIEEQNEQLLHANDDLKQFAYVVSHDLKEPLRMIKSYSRILKKTHEEQLDEDGKMCLHYMNEGAERIETMLGDLLKYARVGIKSDDELIEWINLNEIMEIVLANLNQRIRENNAEVRYSGLPMMYTNKAQMVQLFQNLVGNALKFRGEKDPIVTVQSQIQEKGYLFSVTDNGIGIAEEYRDRVFQMFQRLHSRERYEGTGIGLSVCQKIVHRHNGRIWIESVVGEGATFYFTLLHL